MADPSMTTARMKAVIIDKFGGPEVLRYGEVAVPTDAEVVVAAAWAGVNFVDLYQREGRYPGVSLPLGLGIEGSGIVLRAAEGSEWQPGDRVAYTTGVQGAYAEQVGVRSDCLIKVPDALSLKEACAVIEQGLTAAVLAEDVARLSVGSTVLVHAAAGGVGGLLVQWLRWRGHRVIGTASSSAKIDWLSQVGVEPVRYDGDNDWRAEVFGLTGGKGVDVVFDSVGRSTFSGSLELLAPCGHLVLFGAASGQPDPVDVLSLMRKSATLTRPSLPHYLASPERLRQRASIVFDALISGAIKLRIDSEFTMAAVAEAHRALASRGTQGKLLLAISPELEAV